MESLFEQLVHWLRLAGDAAAAFWIAIGFEREREMRVAARTETVFPAGVHPARA